MRNSRNKLTPGIIKNEKARLKPGFFKNAFQTFNEACGRSLPLPLQPANLSVLALLGT